MALHRPVAPARRHRCVDRRFIAADAFSEVADLRARADLGKRQPLLQVPVDRFRINAANSSASPKAADNSGLAARIAASRAWASVLRLSGRRTQSNESDLGDGHGTGLGLAALTRGRALPARPRRTLRKRRTVAYER